MGPKKKLIISTSQIQTPASSRMTRSKTRSGVSPETPLVEPTPSTSTVTSRYFSSCFFSKLEQSYYYTLCRTHSTGASQPKQRGRPRKVAVVEIPNTPTELIPSTSTVVNRYFVLIFFNF